MTAKELGKLKRPDLLALLVAQGQEAAAVQQRLDEAELNLSQAVEQDARLRAKLDDKDEQIERLKERLNEKDEQIERLKGRLDEKDHRLNLLGAQVEELVSGQFVTMEGEHSLTDISVKLELMLRAAQKAADSYLKRLQKAD